MRKTHHEEFIFRELALGIEEFRMGGDQTGAIFSLQGAVQGCIAWAHQSECLEKQKHQAGCVKQGKQGAGHPINPCSSEKGDPLAAKAHIQLLL